MFIVYSLVATLVSSMLLGTVHSRITWLKLVLLIQGIKHLIDLVIVQVRISLLKGFVNFAGKSKTCFKSVSNPLQICKQKSKSLPL